jgi:hypothetical protein
MMFLVLSATMFIVDKNSIKYGLSTKITPQEGYKGMKNRCLWTGPKRTEVQILHTSKIIVVYRFDTGSLAGIGIDIPYNGTGWSVFWSVF